MGGLFGSKPKREPVQRMPDTEDPAVKEAQRRAAGVAQQRSGRASTLLTSRAQRASSAGTNGGTSAYTNSFLGQAN